MRVSIVTVCYNSVDTIEDAIHSVQAQSYRDIQHIIIDGASKDGTQKKIKRHQSYIDYFISEKDDGIYNAMNKGIRAATGDVIGILNADDYYQHTDVISNVVKRLTETNAEACYGDCIYVDRIDTNKVLRFWKSKPVADEMFFNGEFPPHPTLFIKRSTYERLGLFREDLKLSADFELMFRYLMCAKINVEYIPDIFIAMRMGGVSNRSVRKIIDSLFQCLKAFDINGHKVIAPIFLSRTLVFRYNQTKHRIMQGH